MSVRSLLILQSGGPTAVFNATLQGVIQRAHQLGISNILGARHGFRGLLDRAFVDLSGLSPSDLTRLSNLPGAALGTSRQRLDGVTLARALANLQREGIQAVIPIGGNDTTESARTLLSYASAHSYPLRIVVAPKTIDNDLPEMDHTPGYPSAANFLALTTRDLLLDCWAVQDMYSFTILEVPGRNAGWLAAATAYAVCDDLRAHLYILFPECPPSSLECLVEELLERQRSSSWLCIVVPETLRDSTGMPLAGPRSRWIDPYGHPYPESPAETLAHALERSSQKRARVIRPGALIRSFRLSVTALDHQEAFLVGSTAVEWLLNGMSGVVVALQRTGTEPYSTSFEAVPLDKVASRERLLPLEFIDGPNRKPSAAFQHYLRPLIESFPLLPDEYRFLE